MFFHVRFNLRHVLSIFFLTATLLLPSTGLAADLLGEDAVALEIGSVHRFETWGHGKSARLQVDLPGPGLLTLDATAAGPDFSAAEVVLLAENWNEDLATVLERSATHLAAAVHGSGRLVFRVASEDPHWPAASYKVVPGFTEATVIRDTFLADDGRGHVTRSRFYSAGLAKGEPEIVDPDPGHSSNGSGQGRLLASIATWRTDSLPIKGEPEIVDPDPGARSGETGTVRHVLFYPGACTAAQREEDDDHADTPTCATALSSGRRVAGEIANAWGDDGDVFSFVLREPATVELATLGDTDTFGEILDRAGRVLVSDDDGGDSRNFRLVRLLSPGRYFVRVRGSLSAEGPYELSMTARDR